GSAAFQEELALLKRINSHPTPSQRAIATNFAANFFDLIWEPGYALVRRERLSVPREVRLLAPFAALPVDAYIAAHDAKYLAPLPPPCPRRSHHGYRKGAPAPPPTTPPRIRFERGTNANAGGGTAALRVPAGGASPEVSG